MSIRMATFVALAVGACAHARAQPTPATISLDEASTRVERNHPALAGFAATRDVLSAEAELAALRPSPRLGLDIENALGSGSASGFDGAELSFGLGSVIERGGKRPARVAVAERRREALASAEDAKRLDLLAEVARRYLDLVAAQAEETIAGDAVAQRTHTLRATKRRFDAGASPASVHLAAQAELARANLELVRAQQAQAAAALRLAIMWGGNDAIGLRADMATPFIPTVPAFADIDGLLATTPELRRYADEERLREARVQLARSEAHADIEWRVGVRRLQATDDWGLVGSVTLPLGTRPRAAFAIRAAEAEREAVRHEREAGLLDLRSVLAEAHARLNARALEANHLRDEVIPRFDAAAAAAERAFRAGAASQLEWSQLQAETTTLKRQQLAATVEAQRALIEIQRLTGHAFGATAQRTSTP
ncbi:TolC family protein [Dokdonella sp.]|uniref:TolC family protein n=1 Tax=Dokdonella sp. TaxID=2291710 RepID=UPI0025C227DD|nr:TolC family protein [Dokdonella sp.]MBX3693091.1 TolC family protein [Dokdonella sp.]MCW5567841.1 TolC family protein [Dokdonella sp.]